MKNGELLEVSAVNGEPPKSDFVLVSKFKLAKPV